MAERSISNSELGSEPVPELSAEARELLGAFRFDESPAVGARARHWKELERRLGDGPATVAAEAAGQGLYYAKIIGATVALAAGVLLAVKVVGLGVSAISQAGSEPAMEAPYQGAAESEGGQATEREPRGRPATSRTKARRASAGVESTEVELDLDSPAVETEVEPMPEPEVSAPTQLPSRGRSKSGRKAGTTATTSSSAASDLMAELALIKEATRAKQAGRAGAGLEALARHAERFPSGTLADERRVLRAELLCSAGRIDEARAEVRAFLRTRAGSALSGRMRRACSEGE